ncbi:phage tail protein I [Niallia sp. 01092]|uniref:phage tail protein I n=1 Tax=unclassified Niallia TaxID=2837522 RepID=UPI003FD10B51
MNDLMNMSLLKILPPNLIQSKEDQAMAKAITEILKYVFNKTEILDPLNEIPEKLLDLRAFEEHVDFYDTSLPVETKRELIKKALFFHRSKGTKGAVEDLITTIFGDGQVVEWFEYGGQPFTFKVVTNNPSVTTERALQFTRVVDSVKRKTARLEKVEIIATENLPLNFAGAVHIGEKLTIKQVI